MQRYSLFCLETALHVSGGTSTHHQERIQLYLQHLVFVTPLLLSAAIVEELESVWVCCGWRTPPTAHSNRFQLPDAVDTVICAPDEGWCYSPKHAKQFPDKINCVTLHLVGYILEIFPSYGVIKCDGSFLLVTWNLNPIKLTTSTHLNRNLALNSGKRVWNT
jgi:hypothetical protein